MRNKEAVICGLDLGSSQIKAAVGRHIKENNSFEILAVETISPTGIKGGVVSDMSICTQAVAKVLERIELKTKTHFGHLFLTVPASLVKADFAKGVYLLDKEKRLNQEDVQKAVRSSVEFHLPLDRKFIQTAVKEYVVDGQGGILDPIGMFGRKIEVRTIIFHSPFPVISNMLTIVEEAGYTVNDLVVSPQALAEYILTPQEKETESIILEIGDETTNFGHFKDKFLRGIKSFDIGAGEIAKDLSGFFRIPYEYARELTHQHFDLTNIEEENSEDILLKKENEQYESVSKKDFYVKGAAGANRLFAAIEKYLKEENRSIPVVVCGGAVLIDGFSEKLEEHTGKIKIGRIISDKVKFVEPSLNNPLFLNAVCGCVYGFELWSEKHFASIKERNFFSRLCLKIRDSLEDYF